MLLFFCAWLADATLQNGAIFDRLKHAAIFNAVIRTMLGKSTMGFGLRKEDDFEK